MEITNKLSIKKSLQCFGRNEVRRKKIYCLDDKNDSYRHLISTTGKKKPRKYICIVFVCVIQKIILKSRAALTKSQIGNVLPLLKSFSWSLNFPDDLFTNPLAFHV